MFLVKSGNPLSLITVDFFYKQLRILSRTRVAEFRDRIWYWSCLTGCLKSSCAIGKYASKKEKRKKEVRLLV